VKPVPYTNNYTARLIENKNKSQVSYRNQMYNLQARHILSHKVIRVLPNAKILQFS